MAVALVGDAFKTMLDFAPNAMAITHPQDGRFLFANKAFCQFFEVSSQQLSDTHAADLYVESTERHQIVQRLQTDKAIDDLPVQVRLPNGPSRWAQLSARLVEIQGESLILSTLIPQPISDEDLSAIEEKLVSTQNELQQFAYIVSHDLQEPLRMVDGYMQLIRQRYSGQLDKDGDEFIGFAVDGANRLQHMINDLLVYSRVYTRGGAFRPVQTGEVLQGVLENLQSAIEATGAQIHTEALPEVYADLPQVATLLQHLVANALKFSGKHPPLLHISAERQPDGFAQFCIQDNGIGVDPMHHEQIFLIFRKLHSRDRYPGTGMGLAICKRIVDRHGGRIWIESQAGHGSKVYFTLPTQAEPAE